MLSLSLSNTGGFCRSCASAKSQSKVRGQILAKPRIDIDSKDMLLCLQPGDSWARSIEQNAKMNIPARLTLRLVFDIVSTGTLWHVWLPYLRLPEVLSSAG